MLYSLLEDRALLAVEGEDSRTFLQGILSNDITKATPEQAIYALLLTPQGKYLHDLFIVEQEGGLLLDVARTRLDALLRKLTLYKLRSRVTLVEASSRYLVASFQGAGAFAATGVQEEIGKAAPFLGGVAYVDPRTTAMGIRALLPKEGGENALQQLGFQRDDAAYDRQRIRAVIPEGEKDLWPEKAFPLEYGLEAFHAIDFKKGCYVGQEVTTRTKYRGAIRKRLVRVTSHETLPGYGAEVTAEGTVIGRLCSHEGNQGLALLRIEEYEAAKGRPLKAGEATIQVASL